MVGDFWKQIQNDEEILNVSKNFNFLPSSAENKAHFSGLILITCGTACFEVKIQDSHDRSK